MIKNILNKIWNFSLKKGWDFIWSKTTIDEKAIEIIKETTSFNQFLGTDYLKNCGRRPTRENSNSQR